MPKKHLIITAISTFIIFLLLLNIGISLEIQASLDDTEWSTDGVDGSGSNI